jgi:hypothetical protein
MGDVRDDLPSNKVDRVGLSGTFEAGLDDWIKVAFSCSNSLVVEGNHRHA